MEALRFHRRRRVPDDRTCRGCHKVIVRSATAYEFWAGPGRSVLFHPRCSPTTVKGVLVCPDCLRDMRQPSRWDIARGKKVHDAPYCLWCQGGAA